jgi:truncated hemoglobin YjbI
MKRQHFYTHLVKYDEVVIKIHELDVTEEEKKHLEELAEANLHHTILHSVLNELSEEDKHKFLEHVTKEQHDKLWEHLKDKVEDIEKKIKKTADSFTKELHKDIEEAKKQG